MDDKVFSEKAALVLVTLALIGSMIVGNLIGYDCGFEDGYIKGIDEPNDIPIIYIPYIEPPQPTGYIFITSNTPCSEPYYINTTPLVFEVGEYVKSTSEYKRLLDGEFYGKIIDIEDDLLIMSVGGDTKFIHKHWVEPWDCETIRYDENFGYYCHIELVYGMFSYNESLNRVNVICINEGSGL